MSGSTLTALMKARYDALGIAIMLMERHLATATPGGVGHGSEAYRIALSRVSTLKDLRDSLKSDAPDFEVAQEYPSDPRAPLAEGSRVETVFEVRVNGDLSGALRAVLTSRMLQLVSHTTGAQALIVGHKEAVKVKE